MRIRTIKPEFWTSETIAGLSWDERLLFIGLWSYVDDSGTGRDSDRLIVADLFPLDEDHRESLATVSRGLQKLAEADLITRYTVAGRAYLYVNSWNEHQRIDKPNKRRYPAPDDPDATPTPPLTCTNGKTHPLASRHPRETLATPSRESSARSSGTEEQRNRGTEEKVTSTVTGPPSMALVPAGPTAPRPPNEFDTWWSAYPKKVGKDGARRAYIAALRRTTAAELLDGARRYADDPTRDPGFTANPQTWLNAGRWADEGPTRPPSTTAGPRGRNEAVQQALTAGERFLARHTPATTRQIGAS